jgi:hypothetical protein
MIKSFEAEQNIQNWIGAEHFRESHSALAESKQFTAVVTGYIDILRTSFPSDYRFESFIPLKLPNVDDAGLPFLTDFVRDFQAEIQTDPKETFSLAIIARHDNDGYLIGLGAMKDEKYYGGLLFEPTESGIEFIVSPTEDFSPSLRRLSERIRKECGGRGGFRKRLRAADNLFKFIISHTPNRFTGELQ